MALLSLRPSRFSSTQFEVGSYAYILADRPVRKLGELITPAPITMQATEANQLMQADLIPNEEVDEGEEFFYTVCVYSPENKILYKANIVMPVTNSSVFDLIPVPQDLDSCVVNTLEDNSL